MLIVAATVRRTSNTGLACFQIHNNCALWQYIYSFSFSALALLVEQQERHLACKETGCSFVGGDDMKPLSPPPQSPLAPIKSRTETFWYQLTQIHLENGRKNGKSETDRESTVFSELELLQASWVILLANQSSCEKAFLI